MNEETYDGATTALQRWSKRWKALAKKLRWQLTWSDKRIDGLTAELEASQRRVHLEVENNKGVNGRNMELQEQLATERAAREQAYKDLYAAGALLHISDHERRQEMRRAEQAESERDEHKAAREQAEKERDAYKRAKQENDERFMCERDTALARVKGLELSADPMRESICSERFKVLTSHVEAAETALASARELLAAWLGWRRGKVGREPLTTNTRTWLTSHPSPAPVAAPCAGCAEYQILVENLKFRLKMAEDSNPDNVLSKHNAMLMAIDNADEFKRNWDACHRQHEQCMKLLDWCNAHIEDEKLGKLLDEMLSKGELPEGWDK